MAIGKKDLIELVRKAQAERDPKKREELWKMIREAGLPYDATIVEGPVIGREEPPPEYNDHGQAD